MTSLIGALLGAALGTGSFTAIMGMRGFWSSPSTRQGGLGTWIQGSLMPVAVRLVIAIAGAVAAIVTTGWLVAGFVVGTAAFLSPTLRGPNQGGAGKSTA